MPEIKHRIQTRSKLMFSFDDPRPEQIDIKDIAYSLARLCRFTGHTSEFYSVAQHSVLATTYLFELGHSPEDLRCTLMHDAPEAYLGDVSKPLKVLLLDYQVIEKRVHAAVFEKFRLPDKLPACVKEADMVMLGTERRDLMRDAKNWTFPGSKPWKYKIQPCGPERAERMFLDWVKALDLHLVDNEKKN